MGDKRNLDRRKKDRRNPKRGVNYRHDDAYLPKRLRHPSLLANDVDKNRNENANTKAKE